MNVRVVLPVVVACAAVVGVLFAAMVNRIQQQSSDGAAEGNSITVAATIFPLADIIRHVGGEYVEVIQLVPSGASPHTFTLTPQQVADINRARLLFIIGHGLDNWATQNIAGMGERRIVVVDKEIRLRPFFEGEHCGSEEQHGHEDDVRSGSTVDPHYWLTIPNAQQIARTAAQYLQQLDPANSGTYERNLVGYVRELGIAEEELWTMAKTAQNKKFIAIHDAWSYFAAHYGLQQVGTYEPVEGRQPSVLDLQCLQEIVRRYSISTFYTEPQKQSTSALQFFRGELGLAIGVLDPEGSKQATTYIEMMRNNMRALTRL